MKSSSVETLHAEYAVALDGLGAVLRRLHSMRHGSADEGISMLATRHSLQQTAVGPRNSARSCSLSRSCT